MSESKYTRPFDRMHYCPRCNADWIIWDRVDHSYTCHRCHLHFAVMGRELRSAISIEEPRAAESATWCGRELAKY